ncbi:MAG: hypothetical protein ACPL7D_03040 [Candidatus Sumerlaeaceae bacterium]
MKANDLPCSSPVTYIETKDRLTSAKWITEIRPFCYEEALLATSTTLPTFNRKVVEVLLSYPRTGLHDYFWPRKGELEYDGCTTDVIVAGRRFMKGEPKARTFCCGLTLEVFYKCYEALGVSPLLERVDPREFKRLWFCKELYAAGPGDAFEAFHFGRKIRPEEAVPGDFVQIWRHNKSGHSVIFVGWAYNQKGERVGLHYWSTQEGTHGINFASEALGNAPPMIWLEKTAFARAEWPPPTH